MKTNDLQAIKEIVTGIPVGNYKPRQVEMYDTTTWSDMDYAAATAWRKYKLTTEVYRWRINNTLAHLYGKKKQLQFPENMTTTMVDEIRNFIIFTGRSLDEPGKALQEVAREFRTYMGYPCSFLRKEGNEHVPIPLSRITEAYKAMKSKQIIRKVEKILYY